MADETETITIEVPTTEGSVAENATETAKESSEETAQAPADIPVADQEKEESKEEESKEEESKEEESKVRVDEKKPVEKVTSIGETQVTEIVDDVEPPVPGRRSTFKGGSGSRPSLATSKRSVKSGISLGERRKESSVIEDTRKSKGKIALGDIIDIRRSSVAGEVFDKKTARYMNTYKLESDNPFNSEKVDKILETVMMEALENLTYDPEKCPKQAKWASTAIRARVKALEFDRYKIISIVTIGEKHSQDVLVTCRFLWDAEKDRYSTFSMENTYVFGIAQCFGLYYE